MKLKTKSKPQYRDGSGAAFQHKFAWVLHPAPSTKMQTVAIVIVKWHAQAQIDTQESRVRPSILAFFQIDDHLGVRRLSPFNDGTLRLAVPSLRSIRPRT